MDFAAELQKLLRETEPPVVDPLSELAQAQAELTRVQEALLEGIQKNGADLSLQIEEIYDIVNESNEKAKEANAAIKRENLLLRGLVAMGDLLDNLLPYIQEHAQTIAAKKEEAMNACAIEQLGFPGERLDPKLHSVASAEYSAAPLESVIRVLESGYAYRGKIIRKATVILSKGVQNA